MTVTLELTPDEQARLNARAARAGLKVDAYLHRLVKADTTTPSATGAPLPDDRTLELLAQWREEEASLSPDDLAIREAVWEDLKTNLNANRAATGEGKLFP